MAFQLQLYYGAWVVAQSLVSIGHIVHNKPCFRQLGDASFITLRSTFPAISQSQRYTQSEAAHTQHHSSIYR